MTLCFGHRGAGALAPDNSLAAIEAAAAAGADGVELDVLAGPHGLVLAHEPARVAGAPALDDALALAARLRLRVQLDVKSSGLETRLVAALRRAELVERAFASSPSRRVLAALRVAEPALARALTYPEDRHGLSGRPALRPVALVGLAALRALLPHRLPRLLRAADASIATLNRQVVTAAAVAACHAAGAEVYAWTVNDPALARMLVEKGIDGIISDDPGTIVPALVRP